MKKLTALFLCFVIALSIASCAASDDQKIGSGTPGVVEKLDWSEYDTLLKKAASEADTRKRSLYLHQAEELLINSYAVVPLLFSSAEFLMKSDCHGAYLSTVGLAFSQMYCDDSTKLSVSCATETTSLDGVANSAQDTSTIITNSSASLLTYTEDGTVVPDLAESYQVLDDGCTYVFTLRDGLKWSDGSPLDAHDFEYSWRRAAASQFGFEYANMLANVQGYPDNLDIQTSDDGKIFTVHLSVPTTYFPTLCASSPLFPVKQEYIENYPGYKDSAGNIANPSVWAGDAGFPSAGPYVVDTWKHNESIILKKNPYYYNADKYKTEEFALMLNKDSASVYGAYVSDTISLLYGLIPSDVLPTLIGNPEFYSFPRLSVTAVCFNVIDPAFAGLTKEEAITVRKALSLAIDRNFICEVGINQAGTPAGTFVPMMTNDGTGKKFGENPDYGYPYETGYYKYEPDLQEARRLLESVGYEFDENGKLKSNLTVEYIYNSTAGNEAIATCLQADWAQLGINTTLSSREWAVFLGERTQHLSESYRYSWNADYDDPYTFLSLFISGAPSNDCALGLEPKN